MLGTREEFLQDIGFIAVFYYIIVEWIIRKKNEE